MLTSLEDGVLSRIIDLLPPQSLISLSLTNYKFYHPCVTRLYRTITFIPTSKLTPQATRKLTFQDSSLVYGLNGVVDDELSLRMVEARLSVLNQSLEVNPELCGYVKMVKIFGEYNSSIYNQMVSWLQKVPDSKVYIHNDTVRKYLKSKCQFNSVIIDDEQEISKSDQLEIRCGKTNFDLSNVKSIIIKNPQFHEFLHKINTVISPESVNIGLPISIDHKIVNIDPIGPATGISLKNVKNLQLSIDKFTDLNTLTSKVNVSNLRKLVIYQSNSYDHNTNEIIDLNILNWVTDHVTNFHQLTYFAIIYNSPLKGEIKDGFEGNYLKKLEVLNALIKVLNSSPKRINLVLPNYLEILTCYEQPMNNLMWNGCKCEYCSKYLRKLDDFINFHKYFDETDNYWKDLNNPVTLHNLARYFSKRYLNVNSFDYITDLQVQDWDFHKNPFSQVQFQCFYLQTVYESDYNEDNDVWFDSLSHIDECQYIKLFQHLNVCMVHYLQDIVSSLVNLKRGEAESREIHAEDMNDGDEQVNINSLFINGFQFVVDKELNGTNFFESYYD